MAPLSQNPSDFLPLCKVWSSTAITFRVIRVNPFPDFVFKITDFPILITDDIFEMVLPVWQDDNTKALIDIITDFSQKTRTPGAKPSSNLSGLRQGHTSGYQNPRQRPETLTSTSMLPVAKSTTTRSGYTCATVTISQASFMRHYSSLLSQPIPPRLIISPINVSVHVLTTHIFFKLIVSCPEVIWSRLSRRMDLM